MADIPSNNLEFPKVTFLLVCYNQECFIKEAVQGALDQDYVNLEIIISDDCSTDSTMEIINETISLNMTNKNVSVIRNEKHLGLMNHMNKLIGLVSGDIIILAAGDDISFPERTSKIVAEYINKGKPHLIHSSAIAIDEFGNAVDWDAQKKKLRKKLSIEEAALSYDIYLGASGAWSKELINIFGGINYPSAFEDLVMGFRAIALGSIEYIDLPLLKYRVGTGYSRQPRTLREKIEKRRNLTQTRLDVLAQRIDDAVHLKNSFSKTLLKRMEKEKKKTQFSYHLINLKRIPISFLLKNKILFMEAVYSESIIMCRSFCRKIIKNKW